MGKGWKTAGKLAEAQRKGKVFSKMAKEIAVSARMGGGDPDGNPRLKLAVNAARAASCPKDTIERAILKGTGQLQGEKEIEEVTYEGYGPHGVGVVVECQTDNKNRTVPELRNLFKKHGGALGENGSVAWMFDRVGLVTATHDDVLDFEEEAIEVGAIDVETEEDEALDTTKGLFWAELEDLEDIRTGLTERGWEILTSEPAYKPKNITDLTDVQKEEAYQCLAALEDAEDTHRIYATI